MFNFFFFILVKEEILEQNIIVAQLLGNLQYNLKPQQNVRVKVFFIGVLDTDN